MLYLMPKVVLGSSSIVTCGEQDAAGRLALADAVGNGRGGEDAVLADDEVLDAVSGCNLDDLLDALGRVVPPVAADDERRARRAGRRDALEDCLDEVLGVVLLLEDDDPTTTRQQRSKNQA